MKEIIGSGKWKVQRHIAFRYSCIQVLQCIRPLSLLLCLSDGLSSGMASFSGVLSPITS